MDASGYQVQPDELTNFAGDLQNEIAPALDEAHNAVQDATAFHHMAFGVVFAQMFTAPVRIVIGQLAGTINTLKEDITDAADRVAKAATAYSDHEQAVEAQLKAFQEELSS